MTPSDYDRAIELAEHIKSLPTGSVDHVRLGLANALLHAHAHRRTPGMIDKCPRCGGEWDGDWAFCPEYAYNEGLYEMCPIRRSAT